MLLPRYVSACPLSPALPAVHVTLQQSCIHLPIAQAHVNIIEVFKSAVVKICAPGKVHLELSRSYRNPGLAPPPKIFRELEHLQLDLLHLLLLYEAPKEGAECSLPLVLGEGLSSCYLPPAANYRHVDPGLALASSVSI